ncbi:VIT1/CCC1 transporter family protein [Nocardioides sp. InS609-2]|uniref:VIT1/CCC1 transporter family protein n=1 Tax=Nocardioides sp. InS609-2 TaxID=2760705 RepID=UPI0032C093D4
MERSGDLHGPSRRSLVGCRCLASFRSRGRTAAYAPARGPSSQAQDCQSPLRLCGLLDDSPRTGVWPDSVLLVGMALLTTGAIVGLLSGGPPLRRALRQLAIGIGAAGATYLLGLLFGGG